MKKVEYLLSLVPLVFIFYALKDFFLSVLNRDLTNWKKTFGAIALGLFSLISILLFQALILNNLNIVLEQIIWIMYIILYIDFVIFNITFFYFYNRFNKISK